MSRFVLIAASVAVFSAMPAYAAPKAAVKAAPFAMAADGTTNIADCAKVDVKFRNECISKSRPVPGKQLYAEAAAYNAMVAKKRSLEAGKAKAVEAAKAAKAAAATAAAAKLAKVKASVPAAVVGAPKGFKIGKDGTTNVADCAKAAPQVRNECISRARPLTGKELAKFIKSRAAATPAAPVKGKAAVAPVKGKAAVAPAAVKPAVAAKPLVAPVRGKGFAIAKDGTTNISDCAKANPDFRNECISRARPVPGKVIYASMKPKA